MVEGKENEFKPDKKSLANHKIPAWFEDAKFGIFIHWGLFSVPAFASTGKNIHSAIKQSVEEARGPMKNNPYAEWYLNSLKIDGSSTQKYHQETYGHDFPYDNFVAMFNNEIKKWNPEEMAEIFKKVNAKYVVLVTKHHDGFLLWPSKYPNPKKSNYMASRDIVGELTAAVKKRGMVMGLYYSGIYDWSFRHRIAKNNVEEVLNLSSSKEYREYANNHWYELIDRYGTMVLWNDIGYSPKANINELFAYFYNKIPDGIINDRWFQLKPWMIFCLKFPLTRAVFNVISKRYEKKQKKPPESFFDYHYDFKTPEYETFSDLRKEKWEANRGIGNSFGYNQFETEENYISVRDLIHFFVDVVSKNGNLLLNVGPEADGTIPEMQRKVLEGFGTWLGVNGEAIFSTRPWIRAEGTTVEGVRLRFTKKGTNLFIIALDPPKSKSLTILDLNAPSNAQITLLGSQGPLKWEQKGKNLTITLPNLDLNTCAISLKIQNFQQL